MGRLFASRLGAFAASIFAVPIFLMLVVGLMMLVPAPAGNAQSNAEPSAEDIEAKLNETMQVKPGEKVEIAPMVKKGSSTPGKWSGVPNGIFDHILAVAGIIPGVSDPLKLKGHTGFLQEIKDSSVLNSGGVRSTFGFFVRITHDVQDFKIPVEYFVLMSYDQRKLKDSGKIINAFEFFLFGPVKRAGTITADNPDQPPLVLGLAIDNNGKLLPEVPLELAAVKNFVGDEPADETVKPGVTSDGNGCLKCHGGGGEFPNETQPFPWEVKTEAANETPPPPAAPSGGTNSAPGSNGQTGARPVCPPNDAYCQLRAAEERKRYEDEERREQEERNQPPRIPEPGRPGYPDADQGGFPRAPF